MIQKKQIPLSIIILWLLSVLMIFIVPLMRPDGGLSLDSLIYFDMARKLPVIEQNIYPIGYPFFLRISNFVLNDYYWTSKILSGLMVLGIGLFSIRNRFFVKPTLILLSLKVFTGIFYFSYSETLYVPALYFLFYFIYQYFEGEIKPIKFIVWGTILFFILYTIRYTTVYIGLGLGIFYLFFLIKNKGFRNIFKDPFFYFLLFSLVSILIYILWTLSIFPTAFGENLREDGVVENRSGIAFLVQNLIGLINTANPIYSIKFNEISGIKWIIQGLITGVDILFLLLSIRLLRKDKVNFRKPFFQCAMIQIVVFALAIFYSEYTNQIDLINTRMVIVSSTLLYFIVLIAIEHKAPNLMKYAVALGYISLIFNFVFAVRKPVDYLAYRKKVVNVLRLKPHAQYFVDDSKQPTVTEYKIPFTSKSVNYIHAYYQPAYINEKILMYERLDIKVLKSTTGLDSSITIFNSEIK